MKSADLIIFMNQVVEGYRLTGQPSAARVCRATLKKVVAFSGRDTMSFAELTIGWLRAFETYLKRELADNSVSTYLRMLQAVYNKAVYESKARFTPHLFKKVYKGRTPSRSRALDKPDFRTLAQVPEKLLGRLARTRDLFLLMFYLQGIPFVDLVHLRHTNLQGNRLTYRRHKTGRMLVVMVCAEAMELIERYRSAGDESPYLFPFLTSADADDYRPYESALRGFNDGLHCLGTLLGLSIPLTSYCARHSWASFANHCKIDKKLISEGMGHSSIQVTEIYFKAHEVEAVEGMNLQVIAYAFTGS